MLRQAAHSGNSEHTDPLKSASSSDDAGLLGLAVGMVTVIAAFYVLNRLIQSASRIPEAAYHDFSVIGVGLVASMKPALMLLAVGFVGTVLLWPFRVLAPWESVPFGDKLRLFCLVLMVVIAWPFTTYDYNYYFNHSHLVDRGLLAGLILLTAWRPVFLVPFLTLIFAVMWQVNSPDLNSPVFAHKLMVLEPLIAIAAWWLARGPLKFLTVQHLVFIVAAIIAGRYWYPGLAKLQANWAAHGDVHLLLYDAYARGWLAHLPLDTVLPLGEFISKFGPLSGWGVVAFELGAVFVLLHRWIAFAVLGIAILFHAGVFLLIGFLFWTWVLVDVALLVLLFALHRHRLPIFGWRPFLITALPIAFAVAWSTPPRLMWFDTPLSYAFRYEVIDETGQSFQLTATQFAPYSDSFTMASFGPLFKDHAALTGAYGITKNEDIVRGTKDLKSVEGVFALEKELASPRYSEKLSARLEHFIARYWANRNSEGERLAMLKPLRAPRQFWSMARQDDPLPPYRYESPVREFVLHGVTTWFDGKTIQTVRTEELLRVTIPKDAQE